MHTPPMRYITIIGYAGLFAAAPATVQSQRNALPAALTQVEREASTRSGAAGLATALERVLDDDAILVYPGAPIVHSRASILAMLRAQHVANTRVQWDPVFAELSRDGSLAVMYGTTATRSESDSVTQSGRFTSAWRAVDGAWHLLALCLVNQPAPRGFVWDSSSTWASDSMPPLGSSNIFARADQEFSSLAGRADVTTAFSTYVASDGVIFAGAGQPFTRGPQDVRASFLQAGSNKAQWRWWPVYAVGSEASGLGVTVGEAVIRSTDAEGKRQEAHSQYMTLWRRLPNGQVRFIADGGGQRPARVRTSARPH